MAKMVKKTQATILREALAKLEATTPIRSTGPGSVARAFTEAFAVELGDAYDAMDFNLNQAMLSTATASALDLIGEMYNVRRKSISELASIDKRLGAFYFYINSPAGGDITIPSGTKVYTTADTFVGRQLSYETTSTSVIPAGRVRVWASIKPSFSSAEFTAGTNTLTTHDCPNPAGVVIYCTNPKPIAPQLGLEDDANFRARISKNIRVASAGTYEAVRFAGLAVQGVRDIRIRQTPFGMGTLDAMIVPEEQNVGTSTFNEATAAMQRVAPVGVRLWITRPTYRPMDVSASLIMGSITNAPEQITNQCNIAIMRYLNTLLPGDPVVYNKIVSSIMDVSPLIQDVNITKWAPNGVESVRRNYKPDDTDMIIPGRIDVSLAI